ncbi:hypothetical protein E2C01_102637 [Portunus trituberculatus]|uniref:Uncharacterized protein n=1 Tax=Portunus trituberculatus TaxID=210409 RepID=A0A5B7KN97_PORTR|nr:hypothetical protein [Portunus trituberculatus]
MIGYSPCRELRERRGRFTGVGPGVVFRAGNLWVNGDTFSGTSYLKTHPLGNRCPERGSPTYTRTVDRIRTVRL